jgi:transposase
MLAAVRALNRIEVVGDTRRHALTTLAVGAPEWWWAVSPPDWRDRDTRRAEDDRRPTTQAARAALALTLGHDGWRVRAAIAHPDAPPWRREVPAVALLRRVWIQHSWGDGTQLQWRAADHLPPAARCISSPDDPETHDARQHPTPWVGDNVPSTATCAEDLPPLITHIATTPGPTADGATPPQIHAAVQPRGLLPGPHRVDTGFLDADLWVQRRDDSAVERLGPTRLDSHGHARAGAGCDAPHVQLDGDRQHATCPAGTTRISWTPASDHRQTAVLKVQGSRTDGRRGAHLTQGIRSKTR